MLNLSVSEIIQNNVRIIHNSLYIECHQNGKPANLRGAFVHTWVIINTSVAYQCLMAMILITGDRFLCVYLGLRYRSIWNYTKTVAVVVTTWMVNIVVAILVSVYAY